MHKLVLATTHRELLTASPDVAFLVVPPSERPFALLKVRNVGEQRKNSDIELPSVHQQRLLDIPLQDTSPVLLWTRGEFMDNCLLDFVEFVKDFDAVATIGLFARLEDPPAVLFENALELSEFSIFGHIFAVHLALQLDDVGFGHDVFGDFSVGFSVGFHISMQLAFHSDLVDSIDVVIDLVWQ